jgi:hypothetical protein
MNYVYIGCSKNGLCKVGITTDYKKRLKQLKTGNPFFKYLAVFTSERAALTEIEIHTKFSNKRVQGEWFDLSQQDIKWIMDEYTNQGGDITVINNLWGEVTR